MLQWIELLTKQFNACPGACEVSALFRENGFQFGEKPLGLYRFYLTEKISTKMYASLKTMLRNKQDGSYSI